MFTSEFAIGVLSAALYVRMDDRIEMLVQGVVVVTLVYLSWHY